MSMRRKGGGDGGGGGRKGVGLGLGLDWAVGKRDRIWCLLRSGKAGEVEKEVAVSYWYLGGHPMHSSFTISKITYKRIGDEARSIECRFCFFPY